MATAALRVSGVAEIRPEPSELAKGLPEGSVVLKSALRGQAARAGIEKRLLEGLAPDDVVEIELQEERVRSAPDEWLSAEVCALAAAAFASLEQFSRAIDYYDRVVAAEEAAAPILALEQLANVRVRWANQLAATDRPGAIEQLERAETLLRGLLSIGQTAERWSLLGGVMKRRALLATQSRERRGHLTEMRDAYDKAFEHSRKSGATGDPYPLANVLAARVALLWSASEPKKDRAAIARQLKTLERAEDAQTGTGVFQLVAKADRSVVRALLDGELSDKDVERIEEEYGCGLSRGATPRERESIRTQLTFFRTMAETELPDEQSARLVARLSALENAVCG